MRKKLSLFFVLVMFGMVLVACGDSDTHDTTKSTNDENVEETDESEDTTVGNEDDSNVEESDIGTLTIAYKNTELSETAESGPISLEISGVQVADLEVAEDYIDMFDDEDELTVITVHMRAENSSEDTISMYPDQATLTTDTGEQIEADLFYSDDVGGEFFGEVGKEGEVIFFANSPAEDIGEITLIIDGAHNEDFETIGDDIKVTISTK